MCKVNTNFHFYYMLGGSRESVGVTVIYRGVSLFGDHPTLKFKTPHGFKNTAFAFHT